MILRFWLMWVLFVPLVASGQQRPLFSQYMLNKYYDNPAYAGMERSLFINAAYRNQYGGLPGNPGTLQVGFHLPVYKWFGGAGAQLSRHESGLMQIIQASGSYNYVMRSSLGFISYGARLGINHVSYNGERIITPEGNYEGTILHNDPVLESGVFSGNGVFWEMAVYIKNEVWEAGLMFHDLPESTNSLGLATYTKSRGMLISGQYTWKYGPLNVVPSLMVRSDFRVFQSDVGVLVNGFENFYGGLGVRGYNRFSWDALVFIIGTNIGNHYKVSYSYDLGLSDLSHVYDSTHEILLSYNLNKAIGAGIMPKVIRNPRHL